jgi:hypothetical protein
MDDRQTRIDNALAAMEQVWKCGATDDEDDLLLELWNILTGGAHVPDERRKEAR